MGTTADKLAKLAATKADLKAALAEKGQAVGETFSTYPEAVRAIQTASKTETVDLTVDLTKTPAENGNYGIFYFDGSESVSETLSPGSKYKRKLAVGSIFSFVGEELVGGGAYGFFIRIGVEEVGTAYRSIAWKHSVGNVSIVYELQ